MAEIIDFSTIPKRVCANCVWGDEPNGACTRPGGYQCDWKRCYCFSFQSKDGHAAKRGGEKNRPGSGAAVQS